MAMLPEYFNGNRKFALFGLVLLALIQASLAILIAFSMRELFSTLSQSKGVMPIGLIALISLSSLGIILLRLLERALAERTGQDYTLELRALLFSHLSRVSQDKLDNQQQGSLSLRFIGDLSAIKSWVSLGIPRLIAASILLPALLYLLYWLHPIMFGLSAITLASAFVLMHLVKHTLLPYHQSMRAKRGGIASFMNERLRFAPQLRIAGQRNKIVNVLRRKSSLLRSASVKKALVSGGFKAIPECSLVLITAICFGSAFYLQLGTAEAAVILAIISIFSQPLKDVAGFWDRRHAFVVASRKCQQILDTPSVSKGKKRVPRVLSEPTIENSKCVLRNLHFPATSIKFGQKVLITGKNGSGKSTYLKVLAGITPADRGRAKIGGANVLRIPERLRSNLLFFQGTEVPIFKGSLRNTLTFQCKKKPDDNAILKAIELFNLVGLFKRLGGLTGKVQESGKNLSAGERKRIGLCRAWLSDCKVLLLDEIDDALDKFSLSLIYQMLTKVEATVVIVSHRQLDETYFDTVINLSA